MKTKRSKKLRISKEEARIRKTYEAIPDNMMEVADGLIRRAAYMRVSLEDYETDLDEHGYVEMFSQSNNTPPYERGRPVVQFYNSMNKNYQSIVKQLTDMIPKDSGGGAGDQPKTNGFGEFVAKR